MLPTWPEKGALYVRPHMIASAKGGLKLDGYALCRVGEKEFQVFGSRHAAQSWAEAQYQIKRWARRGVCKLVAVPA